MLPRIGQPLSLYRSGRKSICPSAPVQLCRERRREPLLPPAPYASSSSSCRTPNLSTLSGPGSKLGAIGGGLRGHQLPGPELAAVTIKVPFPVRQRGGRKLVLHPMAHLENDNYRRLTTERSCRSNQFHHLPAGWSSCSMEPLLAARSSRRSPGPSGGRRCSRPAGTRSLRRSRWPRRSIRPTCVAC